MHTIRLHGPWRAEVISCWQPVDCSLAGTTFQCRIPGDWQPWLGADFRGRVAYYRRFGCPSSLSATDRVWLVVDQVDYVGDVWLGDHRLGQVRLGMSPRRFEIRQYLRPRNQLRLEIELPESAERAARQGLAGGLIGGVRLEILSRQTM